MVSDGLARYCGKLPIKLDVCPCCSQGIKPTRGFTWISGKLIEDAECKSRACAGCYLSTPPKKLGLIWVGEAFYSSASKFTAEAAMMGVSRRISQVPKDLEVGKTIVCVAHRKAMMIIEDGKPKQVAGIFHAFIPQRIEYVVKGTEKKSELERLEKRGITLVKIIRDIDVKKKK